MGSALLSPTFPPVQSRRCAAERPQLRLALAAGRGLAAAAMENRRPSTTDAARPAGTSLAAIIVVGGAFTVGLVRLAGLVRACAVNVPFQDQWDLLRPYFDGAGPWAAFRWQHGPHRQGLGGLVNWCLYRATYWDVRAEAWAALAALALAAVAAIALAVRLRGRLCWTDAVFPLVLLSPVHWETMLLTPNLAHGILPVLLVFLLAHAWGDGNPRRQVIAVSMLAALCLFTGFGFCAAFVSGALALLLWWRGDRSAAIIAVVFAVALAAFGWGYRWDPAVPGWRFPVPNWWDYPRFAALMFSSLVGWRAVGVGPALVGGAVLGLVLLVFGWSAVNLWRRSADPVARVAWLLTGSTLAFAAFTAVGRLPVNLEAAFMWRYLPLLTPGVCGVVLFAETRAGPLPPGLRHGLVAAGLVVAAAVAGNVTPERYAVTTARAKTRWIESYLATRDLAAANRQSDFFVVRVDPGSAIIAERLRWLERRKLSFFH